MGGRRRVVLLFAVLAGLFLMHGLSVPSMHGMPIAMSAQMDSVSQVSMAAPMSLSDAVPTADRMEGCETCVPLRPEGMSGLFLALFLAVMTPWRVQLPHFLRRMHPRWPHGPPRIGVRILRTLSISRT